MNGSTRPPVRRFRAAAGGHGRRAAFSLVELIVVLAIVGVLSAIAVPRFGASLTRFRADAAARRVALDLDLARTTAVSSSKSQQVVFDLVNHTYSLPGVQPLDSVSGDYTTNLAEAPYHASLASVLGVDASGFTTTLTYDGYGKPDRGGTITITAAGEKRNITLDADTGKAALP